MILRTRPSPHRVVFIVASVVALTPAAFVACSSDAGDGAVADAAVDGTTSDASDEASFDDASDAGSDAMEGPEAAPRPDASLRGCSPVTGAACDLVIQDCPAGQECDVTIDQTNRLTTECHAAGTGNRPAGASCCPNADNQCVAGLVCVGEDCVDGGRATGRCSPRCCEGDDSICGSSIPEGVKGSCDLDIVALLNDASVPLYRTCTYKPVCKPFRVTPCPDVTYACLLQGDGTSFRCDELFAPPGKPAGAECDIANDCADGMECLGADDDGGSDGISTCQYTCYRGDAGGPFDAGALQGRPGYGGCPDGGACSGSITGAPAWYGYCP